MSENYFIEIYVVSFVLNFISMVLAGKLSVRGSNKMGFVINYPMVTLISLVPVLPLLASIFSLIVISKVNKA